MQAKGRHPGPAHQSVCSAYLAAAGAAENAVDEGGLCDLPRRLGVDALQDGFVHGIQ